MSDIKLIIKIPEEIYKSSQIIDAKHEDVIQIPLEVIANGTPLTPDVLADALMDERIKGKLNSDITFKKDIIRDVECRLTVSIRDNRPCHCGAELREVWRESEE